MVNNVDTALGAYQQAQSRFYKEFNIFIALCEAEGEHTVILSEDASAFISMREMITWAILLYDRIEKRKVLEADRVFMSGIKYIDNILKHEKIVFEIYDILAPGMHISVKADDGKDGPIIQEVEIKPHLVWGDLSNIPVNSKYKNQRDNYINYVKKFNILECLEKIEMIINKYYYKL